MEGQASVGKRIIWALSMLVLCLFSTFLMSMFLGTAFPEMNIIYKAGIPALVFVILGVISYGLKSFVLPFLDDLYVPEWLQNILPFVLIGLGLLFGQFYYDQYADSVMQTDVFQRFVLSGEIYEDAAFGFCNIYQSGLKISAVLFGNTVFAVSVYNRLYLMVISAFLYFAVKNFCGQKDFAANLFLVLFFFAKQTAELSVMPQASLVYVLMISVFLFSTSLVYYCRTKTTNLAGQVISVFVMGCLFAGLFIMESNSVIFALPAILVSFSGKKKQDKRWYYILAVEGMLLILITCAVVFVLKPEIFLNFGYELPEINAVDFNITTIVFLGLIGVLGVYGMWNQRLYYVVPGLLGIYYLFAKNDFASGINDELCVFLCFVLFATLGIGLLDNYEEETERKAKIKERKVKDAEENVSNENAVKEKAETKVEIKEETKVETKVEPKADAKAEVKEEKVKEIENIKELNAKLNKVEAGFVPLTFKQPKRQEKKAIDFAYEPTVDEMHYDIEVSDDDDFDI